jgi:hypothetical protein
MRALDVWERNLLQCLWRVGAGEPVSESRLFIALGADWEVLPPLERLGDLELARATPTREWRGGRVVCEWQVTLAGQRLLGVVPAPFSAGPRQRLSPLASH